MVHKVVALGKILHTVAVGGALKAGVVLPHPAIGELVASLDTAAIAHGRHKVQLSRHVSVEVGRLGALIEVGNVEVAILQDLVVAIA